jgi:hypothetical protein
MMRDEQYVAKSGGGGGTGSGEDVYRALLLQYIMIFSAK